MPFNVDTLEPRSVQMQMVTAYPPRTSTNLTNMQIVTFHPHIVSCLLESARPSSLYHADSCEEAWDWGSYLNNNNWCKFSSCIQLVPHAQSWAPEQVHCVIHLQEDQLEVAPPWHMYSTVLWTVGCVGINCLPSPMVLLPVYVLFYFLCWSFFKLCHLYFASVYKNSCCVYVLYESCSRSGYYTPPNQLPE